MVFIQSSNIVMIIVKLIEHIFLWLFFLFKFMDHLFMVSSVLLLIFTSKNNHLSKDLCFLFICIKTVSIQYEKQLIFQILLHGPMPYPLSIFLLRILSRIIHANKKQIKLESQRISTLNQRWKLLNSIGELYKVNDKKSIKMHIYILGIQSSIIIQNHNFIERIMIQVKLILSRNILCSITHPSNIYFLIIYFAYYQLYYQIPKIGSLQMGNRLDHQTSHNNQLQIASPHIMLNNCKIYIEQNKKKLKSSWPFIQKKIYDDWIKKYQNHLKKLFATVNQQLVRQNPISRLMFLPQKYQFVHMSYCSSNGMVNMQYQMIQDSLIESIEKRSINNQPFTQNEIWAILFFLIKIANYYHQRSMILGDIRPENIFLSQNSHYLKIATENSWLQGKSMLQKYSQKQKMFLTKNMINIFEESKSFQKIIGFSNDSFAIGMTLAQCILLEDLSVIYKTGKEKTRIIEENHNNIIDKLLKIKYYPLKLIMIIVGMIQLEDKSRFDVSQIMSFLDHFKKQIFNQSPISISRSHFKQHFGPKYDNLQQILSNFKTNHSNQLFINRQLSLSNAYTINGLSTVQMVKRTYDQTFNIELLDLSTPTQYRTSQVQGNKSWNGQPKILQFSQQAKKSNVLEQFYITSDIKPKSPLRTAERGKKKPSPLKIEQNLVQSEVKRVFTPEKDRSNHNYSPITNKNEITDLKNVYFGSPQLKIFQGTKDSAQQNFSFHSPQTKTSQTLKNLFNNKVDLHKLAKYTQSQQAMKIPDSLSESFIIENKVQRSPQSYVTYQYSKSKTNSINFDFKQPQIQRINLDFPINQIKKKNSQFTQMQRQSFPIRLSARKRMTLNHNGYYRPQITQQF